MNEGSNKIDMNRDYLDGNGNIYPLSKFRFIFVGPDIVMISSCFEEHGFLNGEGGGQLFLNRNNHFHWKVKVQDTHIV